MISILQVVALVYNNKSRIFNRLSQHWLFEPVIPWPRGITFVAIVYGEFYLFCVSDIDGVGPINVLVHLTEGKSADEDS